MHGLFKYLILLILITNFVSGQNKLKIKGKVTDEKGNPLPYVNVYLPKTLNGAMTNELGEFFFETATEKDFVLVASMVGYKKYETEINVSGKKEINLLITLKTSSVQLSEAVVMGSSFASEKGKGVVLKSIDVLTTPGGAADIYQSLKTMPGLTQVSESAQLYVRGGDPTETVTLIDQAPIYHPYTLESAYGGLFSNLNTASVKNLFFSSGGFSVKYGNVLSGVLDIETKDLPESYNFNIGISMASAEINAELPLSVNKLGLRLYAQQSFTKPIMWLNGSLDEFTTTPTSTTINASLNLKYSDTGKLKLFGMFADDKQGVNVQRAELNSIFNGNSENMLINLQQTDVILSDIVIKNSVSFNSFTNKCLLGILDLTKKDNVFQIRSDLEKIVSSEVKILAGAVFQNRTESFEGIIPLNDYDIRKEGTGKQLNERIISTRVGVYTEFSKLNLFGEKRLYGIAGFRTDYFHKFNSAGIDPRMALGYKINENSVIKIGWGIFHQLPGSRLLAEKDGNPNLKLMRATHYVVSYEHNFDNSNMLRLEAYHKNYKNLPLEDAELNYTSNGYGFAEGIDLIIKGELPYGINGWISYGFINTKRYWLDYEKLSRSAFDITHNLAVVVKYNLSALWQIGLNFKFATGKPFTPVISSEYLPIQNIFKPVYGEINSVRYPDYKRLDFRITHFNKLSGKYFAVFYAEIINLLDFKNLFGYTYNFDYSERKIINSYFGRRTVVFGTSINF